MNTVVTNRITRTLLLSALLVAPAGAQQLPTAKDIYAKYVTALGGTDVIKKHTMMHITGNFEVAAAGISGTIEIWNASPDKLVTSQEIAGVGSVKTGYDGKVAWSIHPMLGASVLTGKQLDQIKQQADMHTVLNPEKHYQSLETVEKATFDGKEAYKVKLVTKSGEEFFEFFDATTGLNIGTIRKVESQMGPVESTTYFSEYKTVDGQLVATKMRQAAMGMDFLIVVNKVEFNNVDPAVFELPKEIKAISGAN